MRSDGLTAAD
jgi:hypothetical protein